MILAVVLNRFLLLTILTLNLYAMNCSDYKNFQLYNGNYYSISIDKLTFDSAKQIAENNGGTLAIPNNSIENEFIKNVIGGGTLAWIGIHDPNKIQNYCYGGACTYDDSRFKTVTNKALSYKNFHSQQPDNLIKQYDVVDGKQMVSPLGEHWVAMSGTNGQWLDVGNHADEYNNPVKYKAVFEFKNLNDCMPPSDDGEQDLKGRFCNTKIWDDKVDTITPSQTFDCLHDEYGNEYCPSALAKASTYWDYQDGYSISSIGTEVSYTNKITTTVTTSPSICTAKICGLYCTNISTAPGTCGSGTLANTSACFNSICTLTTISAPATATYNIPAGTSTTMNALRITNSSSAGSTTTITTCPSGYSNNGSNCKRTISYTYYIYLCSNSLNEFGENYNPINNGGTSSRSSTPPKNNCARLGFTCNSNIIKPAFIDNEWKCSPFPCLGESNIENLDTNVGTKDKNNNGWEDNGDCSGTIYIFNGKSKKCRAWDMFFGLTGGGCCNKEKVAAGLVACKEEEKLLAKKREKKHTHYVGQFCSKKLKLGFTKICIQKSDSYCVFNSTLAKVIQEQGREQLAISWGSAENPKCRGFTPEEFQKIDFSKIDLTEFVQDIQSSIQTNIIDNLGTYVKDKVENFYEN